MLIRHSGRVLIVFGGLPATGKTTLSRLVAQDLSATWLRIDAIEAAMLRSGIAREEPTGLAAYVVANVIAGAQLSLRTTVVVDAVNPVEEARRAWRDLAACHGVRLRLCEVVCSDRDEHRRRVEKRESDLDGLKLPTWDDVIKREYEPWTEPRLIVDTVQSRAECLTAVFAYIGQR
jgi:predicted kinase